MVVYSDIQFLGCYIVFLHFVINKACRSAREALPYGITGSSSAAFDGLAAMKMLTCLHFCVFTVGRKTGRWPGLEVS